MGKVYTHFQAKMASKQHPLGRHITYVAYMIVIKSKGAGHLKSQPYPLLLFA